MHDDALMNESSTNANRYKKSDEQKVAEIFRCICFEQIKLQCNERSAAAVRTEEARNGWTDEMPIFPSIMSQMSLPK